MSASPRHPRPEAFIERRARKRGLRPRDAALLIVIVWLVAVIVWGVAEHLLDSETFPTVWLGMWWALQTVTTVGYGDVTPVSTEGRAVAAFLLLGGLSLISVVTGVITSAFVSRAQRELAAAGEDPTSVRLEALNGRLERIERRLEALGAPDPGGGPPSGAN